MLDTEQHVPSSLKSDALWKLMLVLANASVYEELISRALLIGLPLMLIYIAIKKTDIKHSFKILLGGNIKIGNIEIIFLLISSIMFSLAHLGGWDVFKLPSTLIGGLIFGYLFLRYGLYMSILFHFTIDYLLITESLLDNFMFTVLLSFMTIFLALVGAVYSIKYLRDYIKPRHFEHHENVEEFTPMWHQFTCPTCGNNVFHYLPNNQVKCANCNAVYQMQENNKKG